MTTAIFGSDAVDIADVMLYNVSRFTLGGRHPEPEGTEPVLVLADAKASGARALTVGLPPAGDDVFTA